MFNVVSYQASGDSDPLRQLVLSVEQSLKENMQLVQYPNGLAIEDWGASSWEIDELNKELLNAVQRKSGVYVILTSNNRNRVTLRYIGQTVSKYSKGRIRAHIVWRNKTTKSGKFTGSKFDEVQAAVSHGSSVYISFVEIKPELLRHYVEESLLKKFSPEWNIQQVSDMTGRHRNLCDWDDCWVTAKHLLHPTD